jgi:hypothetical protein
MQPHSRKHVSEDEVHAFRHVALAGMRLLRVIAEVATLEHAANDLAQDEGTQNRSVCAPANEEAFDVRLAASFHPTGERGGVGGRQHPAVMERATQPVPRNDLRTVTVCRFAEVDAFTDFERLFLIRFGHAVPTIPERPTPPSRPTS